MHDDFKMLNQAAFGCLASSLRILADPTFPMLPQQPRASSGRHRFAHRHARLEIRGLALRARLLLYEQSRIFMKNHDIDRKIKQKTQHFIEKA